MRTGRRTISQRAIAAFLVICLVGSSWPARAQVPPRPGPPPPTLPAAPTAPPTREEPEKAITFGFKDAPIEQVVQFYGELVGRTLLRGPGLPGGAITLKAQTRLTQQEALAAIESVLAMHGVALVPMGEKFLKVVPIASARQEGMAIGLQLPEKPLPEADQLISQVVPLRYIEINEAQSLIQQFIHGYGKIQPLERTGSLLITDTAANIQRILEILSFVDQPAEARVETRIYELKYVEAAKLAARLNELIADTQAKEERPRVAAPAPTTPAVTAPPGIIRAPRPAQPAVTELEIEQALAERGIVQGRVKIVADERTNILIIISRPPNFAFFDKIISVLDRPVDPEVVVKVVALEYAKAEEISGILNEFIGAAKAETRLPTTGEQPATPEAARSQALQEFVARRAEERIRQLAGEKTRIGELSPNTKILADKRTNSLLLMGTRADIAALEELIDQLDTMLAQVLIEAVILEVSLSKRLEYGVDWLQRAMAVYSDQKAGPGGGVTVRRPLYMFGGGQRLSEGSTFRDPASIARGDTGVSPGGLTYYTTLLDLNIDAVIRMAAGSSDARILSTPVILTTDNTEAKIVIGEERPVVTQTSTTSGGEVRSSYEYRSIGINLSVTPRINPARYVTMEIKQSADNVGGFEVIDGNRVPVITKREMSAQVSVGDRGTIVLGGLVGNDRRASRAKIPILGDIPLLGTLFRMDTRNENRTELLVLMTPYVLMTEEEARQETARLHGATRYSQTRWQRGWSDSQLAGPSATRELPTQPSLLDDPSQTRKKGRARKRVTEVEDRNPPETAPTQSRFLTTVPEDISAGMFGAPSSSPPEDNPDAPVAP